MNRLKKRLRGIHLKNLKHSAYIETVDMPLPEKVILPMEQHIGAPCEPLLAVGDKVKKGQKIADSEAFFSAPIYAPISGEITDISRIVLSNTTSSAITIVSDGKNEFAENIKPPIINNKEDFIKAVRESGAVGLGGAGFPTHVKLAYKDIDKVHTLLINAAECEPYITSDNRECIENADGIIDGIKLILKYTGIPKAIIATEKNKPVGMKILQEAISRAGDFDISIKILNSVYPNGAEKVIVYKSTGIFIEDGKLPADCGIIVLNVTTVSAIAKYINTGMPLIEKRITVDGDIVKEPKNIMVAIGTQVEDILTYAEVDRDRCNMIIMGGVMMGVCMARYDIPVMKNTNAVLFFEKIYDKEKSTCIRCSKCIMVCPLNLMPQMLEKSFDARDPEALKKYDVNICMNCGCCSYVCPAKRDLSHKIQLAKIFFRNVKG